ncbi:hypothetical protein IE53DRAFT_342573 [Violaceomyces palustris]|uniref:Uncharacterized protein n=1 Tax=Violaceomyces palustris TaxID=1673888 RepID=A0ACD0NZT8_9BASI|nr:hypothetical protein IE53DRAFT_342573 [Violaceomyces palustris]
MSWFSNQWSRWSNGLSPSQDSNVIRRVEVVWGRERMQVVLPKITAVTLGHLKHEISSITSIPYEQVKLIHQGLILKDDRSALTAYGIREGSRLILVGTAGGVKEGDKVGSRGPATLSVGEQRARAKKKREEDTSEEGLMARIEETLSEARNSLFPEVVQFEESPTTTREGLEAQATTTTSDHRQLLSPEQIMASHRRLSEMLLRCLLSLDNVQVNSDATRAARKAGVKDVQSHLDRLDFAWNLAKEKGIKASM